MYYPLLDLLRFIAATAVMFHHYFQKSGDFFSVYGYLGVPLFFIISGFVIYLSFKDGEIKNYILSRFMRIYPLFWITCTITYVVTIIFSDTFLPFKTYLLNLLIIGNWVIVTPVDNSSWTLPFEIIFYVAFGLFVFLLSKKRATWFFITWLLVTFTIFKLSLFDMFISKILMVRFAPFFCFGGILAIITDSYKKTDLKNKITLLSSLLFSAYLPYLIYNTLPEEKRFYYLGTPLTTEALIIVYSFFIIVPAAVFFSKYIKSNRLIERLSILGGITYPLYLLHQKIGSVFVNYFNYTDGVYSLVSISVALVILLLSYIVSIYEKDIRKGLLNKIKTLF